MTDAEKAARVLDDLKAAERKPADVSLKILNGLAGLVQGGGEQPLEVEEARSSAFLAICEVGKALHRVPNPKHPQGVKGVGEVPLVPVMAAVANAVYNALGKRFYSLPMSPPKVLEGLEARSEAAE